MNKLFILCTIFLCVIAAVAAKHCFRSDGWIINVINEINNDKVLVHCKSKDDDIGMRALGYLQSVNWEFCENIVGPSTLYFCQAYKGQQEQVFDVFNQVTIKQLCREPDRSKDYSRCTWLLRADGIYLVDRRTRGEEIFMKMHDWKNRHRTC